MRTDTKESNELHKAALAVVAAAVKSGIPIDYGDDLLSSIKKKNSSKSSSTKLKKIILTGMNPTEMVKAVLAHHKNLTRLQIIELTGLAACSISRAAKTLEGEGFLTRGPAGKGIGRQVLFSVVEK